MNASHSLGASSTIRFTGQKCNYDKIGFLSRIEPINGAIQNVVTTALRVRLLYQGHYPTWAGHPGGRRMYESICRDSYHLYMANDVYKTVMDCRECSWNKSSEKCRRQLELFQQGARWSSLRWASWDQCRRGQTGITMYR